MALAAVPHRAYAADLPAGGLAAVSENQSPLRRRRFAGDGRHGITDSSRAGLSFRAASADGQGSAPRRACGDFLAHSLAECGSFWHLPLAARTCGRFAWG